MATRRDFLHVASLAAPLLLMPVAAVTRTRTRRRAGRRAALGLFFDDDDLPRLRERFASEPLFTALRQRLNDFDRAGERRFLEAGVRYDDHLYHIARVSNTAGDMAFYFAMTDDRDAGMLAAEAVRTLMNFPRWDYFLDGGEHVIGLQRAPGAVMAVSLASDWLGDFVDDEERTSWLRTMGIRGLEPSFRSLYGMRYPEEVAGWTIDERSTYFEHRPGDRMDLSNWPFILDKTNLKAVPASALAVGTAAYRQRLEDDDDTARWQEQAVHSVRSFRTLFTRDGSYDEGVSYANYTALHLAQAIAVQRRLFGLDLFDIVNWPGYTQYLHEMSMPTRAEPTGIVNFGDNSGGSTSAVPFWTASRTRDGRSRWFGEHLAADHDEWSLIWYDPEIPSDPPPNRPHLWRSDLDWMVARTGYTAEDLVVAMRSGGPANHEHADRNGIIVKCFGETLVADPYRPPYSFSDPSWTMRTTAGHSALLIDGEGHQYHDGREGTNPSDAEASVVRMLERDDYCAWTSDATPAYRLVLPDVSSVTRTLIVLYRVPAIIVLDKVIKTRNPSRIQARYFGYNRDGSGRIEANGGGFLVTRPGAILTAVSGSPLGAAAHADTLPVPEETARLHPFAEVGTRNPGLAPFLITVLVPETRGPDDGGRPLTGGEQIEGDLPAHEEPQRTPAANAFLEGGVDARAEVAIRSPGGDVHEIVGAFGSRSFRCTVFDTDTVPEFEIDLDVVPESEVDTGSTRESGVDTGSARESEIDTGSARESEIDTDR